MKGLEYATIASTDVQQESVITLACLIAGTAKENSLIFAVVFSL
jgi:hypothetical protein